MGEESEGKGRERTGESARTGEESARTGEESARKGREGDGGKDSVLIQCTITKAASTWHNPFSFQLKDCGSAPCTVCPHTSSSTFL